MTVEVDALKTEIREAILRRLRDDGRSSTVQFGLASTAVAEVLADMIFAAARDEAHGVGLLKINLAVIEGRWRALAMTEARRDGGEELI